MSSRTLNPRAGAGALDGAAAAEAAVAAAAVADDAFVVTAALFCWDLSVCLDGALEDFVAANEEAAAAVLEAPGGG